VDDRGVLHGDIQVDIASDIPEPARVGLSVHLAETPENVHWLGLGPHENYPDRKLAAQQGRWTLPWRRCTPYIFPTENGLRCDTRELGGNASAEWPVPLLNEPLQPAAVARDNPSPPVT
jgi:beta-galactosidase